ncbi:MAG: Flp pilus assembly protein TadD, partial [Pseudohongiellaceae bacterium]
MFRLVACLILLCSCLSPAVKSQLPAHLVEGQQQLLAGKFDEAATAFAAITDAHPNDGQAWMLYGFALHAGGMLEEALVVHEKAANFSVVAAIASDNAACAAALLGRLDESIGWLTNACNKG